MTLPFNAVSEILKLAGYSTPSPRDPFHFDFSSAANVDGVADVGGLKVSIYV
jgi:hypothetical protein